MGLIDVVRKAQNSPPQHAPSTSSFPLQPSWLFCQPKFEEQGSHHDQSRHRTVHGDVDSLIQWSSVPPIADNVKFRIQEEERLVTELTRSSAEQSKVASFKDLDALLRGYLETVVAKEDSSSSGGKFFQGKAPFEKLLKQSAANLGVVLVNRIIQVCVEHGFWDVLSVLLECEMVSGSQCPELILKLVEEGQAFVLCLWIRSVRDPRPSDLLLVLKFFLKIGKPSGKSFGAVRQHWHRAASAAIARIAETERGQDDLDNQHEGYSMVKENGQAVLHRRKGKMPKKTREELASKAVALGTAVDGFRSHELCLHNLVASGQDEAVLASVIAQLDSTELLRLLQYLEKWLKKHSTMSIRPYDCKTIDSLWIPSLAQILHWAAVVFDVHYTTLVLCSDFHVKIRDIQNLIKELVDMGLKVSTLVGITEHIRSSSLLPAAGVSGRDADHIIEFLDIS